MKFSIGDIMDKIRDYRSGDRIVMDNGFSYKASVFKKSSADKPLCSFGFDGGFQLTLLEVILIAFAAVALVLLIVRGIWQSVCGIFSFGHKNKKRRK